MDALSILIFLVVTAFGVWTIRTVRRVGVRRFVDAVAAFAWTVLRAVFNRSTSGKDGRSDKAGRSDEYPFVDALDDTRIANETLELSRQGSHIGDEPHY